MLLPRLNGRVARDVAPFVMLLGLSVAACALKTSPAVEPVVASRPERPPVVNRADSSWAAVGRQCAASEPVWNPTPDSIARVTPTRDTEWAMIAREVPGGFAGLYLEHGRVVVLLTDTLQRAAALPALRQRMSRLRPDLDYEGARVVQARWNFAELYDWSAYIVAHRLWYGELTTFDIDERANRLVYGFPDAARIRKAEQQIRPLALPCYLVAFVVEQPVIFR